MSKLTLDKEQMDKLKEMGVDTSKAHFKEGFTLQEIIDLLPEYPYEYERDRFCRLYLTKDEVSYLSIENFATYYTVKSSELIDAAFGLLVESIEVGYNYNVRR